MESSNFAYKIRTLRQQRGLTVRELEERTGIGHSTIVRWEHGSSAPCSQRTLKILAEFFNVPITYFMDDTTDELIRESPIIKELMKRVTDLESRHDAHYGHHEDGRKT